VPGIRSHDLRRAAASLAFAQGASVKEVQTMLRHTRQATTADVYVHVMESVRQGTASKMDKDPVHLCLDSARWVGGV
jgi:integrase